MPTIYELECIVKLCGIVKDTDTNDLQKKVLAKATIHYYEYYNINIPYVVQNFGEVNSPIRLAILNSLPRTFGVFHELGGNIMQFHMINRTANHSFLDLVSLMEKNPAFSSNESGNFGYGGIIGSKVGARSWLDYYEGELDIEIRAERTKAKNDMLNSDINLPIIIGEEDEAERSLVFSRRPSGTLVCRQNEIPEGNTLQEYTENLITGCLRFKAH